MTHFQQLQRFTQDDKWKKLRSDFDRGHPTSKEEMLATLEEVIKKAKNFKETINNA